VSVTILKSAAQANTARGELRRRGLGPRLLSQGARNTVTYAVRTRSLPPRPDWSKAWDLGETLRLIETTVAPSARIVDLGAFNSALIPALIRLGYSDVVGIDLDPRLPFCPYADKATYLVEDFHHTSLMDASCAAVTAISTIEHGWDGERLLPEVARVLKPGGLFIASTDYWPDKIDTSGVTEFGLSWTIFSEQELRGLVATAATAGLAPAGGLDFSVSERPIHWSGRSYTFAHIVLRRL
jgi:SAM-dependent methyltransferase